MQHINTQSELAFGEENSVYGFGILPKSMSAAVAMGATYFFTGKPCRHGHIQPRYTKGGRCYWCTCKSQAKRSSQEFTARRSKKLARVVRDLSKAKGDTFYIPMKPCKHGHALRFSSSGNCVECHRASVERRKLKSQQSRIRREYGLSDSQHLEMYERQGCSCAICSKKFINRFELHVDHCHASMRVRGLLCQMCNQAIGLFRDDTDIIKAALEYLK